MKAIQVSLGFERAHPKVWEFFREHGMLIAFGKKTRFLTEGSRVIAYVPKSQGGRGVVGIGTVMGAPSTFFSNDKFSDDAESVSYRAHLRAIFSDPRNKPAKPIRCFNKTVKSHQRRLKAEGKKQMTAWDYSQRWLSDAKFIASRKKALHSSSLGVRIPIRWDASVDYNKGLPSIDWAAVGLEKFNFPSPSSLVPRKLTAKHWDVIKSQLQAGKEVPVTRRLTGKRPSPDVSASSGSHLGSMDIALKSQGKPDSHPDVARLSEAIRVQQQAKLAEKPSHVRVAKAEKQIKQSKQAVAACAAKAAKLQEQLASVQQQLLDNDAQMAAATATLQEAESQRDELLKSLQKAAVGAAAEMPSMEGAFAASAILPEEAFAELGCTRHQVNELLQRVQQAMAAFQEKQASAAHAATAATTAAAMQTRLQPAEQFGGGAGARRFTEADLAELERQSVAAKRVSEFAAARVDQGPQS